MLEILSGKAFFTHFCTLTFYFEVQTWIQLWIERDHFVNTRPLSQCTIVLVSLVDSNGNININQNVNLLPLLGIVRFQI